MAMGLASYTDKLTNNSAVETMKPCAPADEALAYVTSISSEMLRSSIGW